MQSLPHAALYLTSQNVAKHTVTRATLYQMFDPTGSDRIFFCKACGNAFAPTPAEKEKIERGLASGTI